MKVCNNFFKLLIILLLISIVISLSKNLKENFLEIGETEDGKKKCNTQENCDRAPEAVRLIVNTNNARNTVKLTWKKPDKILVDRYFIIMFKNELGPFVIKPNINIEDDEYIYDFVNPELNVKYSFCVIGENFYGLGKVDKLTEAILTPEGIELKYIQDISNKVSCNADGSFKISDKCIQKEEVESAKVRINDREVPFNNNLHKFLMDNMNEKAILKFNF